MLRTLLLITPESFTHIRLAVLSNTGDRRHQLFEFLPPYKYLNPECTACTDCCPLSADRWPAHASRMYRRWPSDQKDECYSFRDGRPGWLAVSKKVGINLASAGRPAGRRAPMQPAGEGGVQCGALSWLGSDPLSAGVANRM